MYLSAGLQTFYNIYAIMYLNHSGYKVYFCTKNLNMKCTCSLAPIWLIVFKTINEYLLKLGKNIHIQLSFKLTTTGWSLLLSYVDET